MGGIHAAKGFLHLRWGADITSTPKTHVGEGFGAVDNFGTRHFSR
jgi:hypothetical protein